MRLGPYPRIGTSRGAPTFQQQIYENLVKSRKINENQWKFLKIHENEIYENLVSSGDASGPLSAERNVDGGANFPAANLWKSIKINENQWKSMKLYENQWKFIKIHKKPWKSMEIYENVRKSEIYENLVS